MELNKCESWHPSARLTSHIILDTLRRDVGGNMEFFIVEKLDRNFDSMFHFQHLDKLKSKLTASSTKLPVRIETFQPNLNIFHPKC